MTITHHYHLEGRPAELASQFLSFLPEPVTSVALSILFGPPGAFSDDQLESHIKTLRNRHKDGDPSQILWKFLLSEMVVLPKTTPVTQKVVDPVIAGLRLLCSGKAWSHEQAEEARTRAHEMSFSWARRLVELQEEEAKFGPVTQNWSLGIMAVEAHVALVAANAAYLVVSCGNLAGLDGEELALYMSSDEITQLVYSSVNQICVCHARAAQATLAEDASPSDSISRSLEQMKRHRHFQLDRLLEALVNHPKGSIAFDLAVSFELY